MKFIDGARFMASSLSNLADNLTEGTHETNCKSCGCFHEYKQVKKNLFIYKCLSCNKSYSKNLNGELKKILNNTFKISNNDINKFIQLLRKGIYSYKYIDDLEKVNLTTLPKKEEFYRNLNIDYTTHANYIHAKRVCKDFEIKKFK